MTDDGASDLMKEDSIKEDSRKELSASGRARERYRNSKKSGTSLKLASIEENATSCPGKERDVCMMASELV